VPIGDAARQEHLVCEAQAAAEGIVAMRPQTPEFQNAPLKVFGQHDEATIAQMCNCTAVGNVVAGVICADGYLGYAQPVGGVIAYEKQISISGVGFDIGCGNMAVRIDTPFAAIADKVGPIIRDVARTISFGVGRTNDERVGHELFDDADAWRESDMEAYRQTAGAQLGTVGGGNHYVDLMRDEDGFVWIGVHFGSRGLGHTSTTRYLKAAGGKDGMNVPPAVIDEDSELGRRYIAFILATEVGLPLTSFSESRERAVAFNGFARYWDDRATRHGPSLPLRRVLYPRK
jgi:tRNA-splicing ligase RtcB (3'-phosphate/5'-hydroxy nucleic acid ligase)